MYITNTVDTEVLDTVAALRATPPSDRVAPMTRGRLAANDGGRGPWIYDPSSAAVDNGISVVKPTSVGAGMGRFLRYTSERVVHAAWGGVKPNLANASARLLEMLTHAVSERKPLVLEGGDWRDETFGYFLDSKIIVQDVDGIHIECPSGFARIELPEGAEGAFLLGGSSSAAKTSGIHIKNLYVRRSGTGGTIRIANATDVKLESIGGRGQGGGLVSVVGTDDFDWTGYSWLTHAGTSASNLSTFTSCTNVRVPFLVQAGDGTGAVNGGGEVIDAVDVDGLWIAGVDASDLHQYAVELSSARNFHVGPINALRCEGALLIKIDSAYVGLPDDGGHVQSIISRQHRGIGVQFNNSATKPGETPAEVANTFIRDIHLGPTDIRSSVVGSIGVTVGNDASRPRADNITFARLDVDVDQYPFHAINADNLDLGEFAFRMGTQTPLQQAVYFQTCKDYKGTGTFSGVADGLSGRGSTGALRVNASRPNGFSLRQIIDAQAVAAGLPGKVAYLCAWGGTVEGEIHLDADGVETYGVAFGTAASSPVGGRRLRFTSNRIIAGSGIGVEATNYRGFDFTAPDGGEAYVYSAGARAILLSSVSDRRICARVQADGTTTSAGAFQSSGTYTDINDQVTVEDSGHMGSHYATSAALRGRIRLKVKKSFGHGAYFRMLGAEPLSGALNVEVETVDTNRQQELNGAAASGYAIVLSNQTSIPIRGWTFRAIMADTRAVSKARGLRAEVTAGAAAVLEYSSIEILGNRVMAADPIVGEALLSGATNRYFKSIHTA